MSSDNNNDILKEGYVRLKRKTFGQWRKVYLVFKRESFEKPPRFEKRKSRSEEAGNEVPLRNVERVVRLPKDIKEYAVSIDFNDGTSRMFACDSEFDAAEWVKLLEQECLRDGSRPLGDEIRDTFHVKLVPTPNLEVNGECQMQITSDSIHLFDINEPSKCLVTWPLNALRKYGRDTTRFTFEAGRFCPTGEGIFIFRTTEGEKIHSRVHAATLAIAAIHKNTSTTRKVLGPTRSLPPTPPVSPPSYQHSTSVPAERYATAPPPPPPRPDLLRSKKPAQPPPLQQKASPAQNGGVQVRDSTYAEYTSTDDMPTEMAPPSPSAVSTTDAIHSAMNRPVPVKEENEDEELEYIYEEKYLANDFRKFLNTRKQESDSPENDH